MWLLQFISAGQKERGGRSEMLTVGWLLGPGLFKGNKSPTVVRAVTSSLLQELLGKRKRDPSVELVSPPKTAGQVATYNQGAG